jgi:hypothetical protein
VSKIFQQGKIQGKEELKHFGISKALVYADEGNVLGGNKYCKQKQAICLDHGCPNRGLLPHLQIIYIYIYMKYENRRLIRLVTSKLPSKASYRMIDKGRDGSDRKTRKKT